MCLYKYCKIISALKAKQRLEESEKGAGFLERWPTGQASLTSLHKENSKQ